MQEQELISASEFCVHYQVEMNFIHSLQEYGLLEIVMKEENIFIPSEHVCALERMARLHYELEVNMEGIDVIVQLLRRLEAVRAELYYGHYCTSLSVNVLSPIILPVRKSFCLIRSKISRKLVGIY